MSRFRQVVGRPAKRSVDPDGLTIRDVEGRLIHHVPNHVANAVRYLLARIQLNDSAGLPDRLALTAALSGEGVTFISRTLAAAIAHDLQRSVCLVSLNWWSEASQHRSKRGKELVDSNEIPGISDVIADDLDITEALQPTHNEDLWLTSSGSAIPSRRPVLAKDGALDEIVDELVGRFDHVIIDLPPVFVTSDALTLIRLCDAYALVARWGVTTPRQVSDAIEELRGATSLGVVLNRASSSVPRSIQKLTTR